MKALRYALALLIITSITADLGAQCFISPSSVYTFHIGGKKYELIKERKDWAGAAQCAVQRGAKLGVIDNQTEQDSIFDELANRAGIILANTVAPDGGGASYVWLGANDLASEGVWIWDPTNSGSGTQFWQGGVNGMPVGGAFTNWGKEPDNFNNAQDGLGLALTQWPLQTGSLGNAGQWNDINENNAIYFLLEFDSIPSGFGHFTGPIHELRIAQNPVSSSLDVLWDFGASSPGVKFAVTDDLGRRVLEGTLNGSKRLDVSHLENGVYFLNYRVSDMRQKCLKFVIIN